MGMGQCALVFGAGSVHDLMRRADRRIEDEVIATAGKPPCSRAARAASAASRWVDIATPPKPKHFVGGSPGKALVHYEAPLSRQVTATMTRLLTWFAKTTPAPGRTPLIDGLARAAIAHLWFESIHPFEDGNGRRQRPNRPSHRGHGHRTGPAGARAVVQPVAATPRERQRKILQRLLDDGDGGFLGGLNADKYIKLTGTSKPSAARDLAGWVRAGLVWTPGAGQGLALLRQRTRAEPRDRVRRGGGRMGMGSVSRARLTVTRHFTRRYSPPATHCSR